MEKEITLKCNSNIFGFQFKKGTQLWVNSLKSMGGENQTLNIMNYDEPTPENANVNVRSICLDLFDRTPDEFIKEANRINELFEEVKKENGQLPRYSFDVINENKEESLKATLFGMNQYLLTPNFGSDINIKITPFKNDISYLEYLQQSAHSPFVIDFIHLECTNKKQLESIIHHISRDANGQTLKNPIILQNYRTPHDENCNELIVYNKSCIDGNSFFQFDVLPNTILKVKVYGKIHRVDSESLRVLNSLLSCQIQQGIDFVSVDNVKKFAGTAYNDFNENSLEIELNNLFEKGFIDFKDGLYGYKFKLLKVDGTIKNELSLTQVLKHSEYNIK